MKGIIWWISIQIWDIENIQVNPFSLEKTVAMIGPTPRKIEITSKRSQSEAMEVEEEDSEESKRYKTKSKNELVEVWSNKMKEKSQGPDLEVQEYIFLETREGSCYNFKSMSDLYDRYR